MRVERGFVRWVLSVILLAVLKGWRVQRGGTSVSAVPCVPRPTVPLLRRSRRNGRPQPDAGGVDQEHVCAGHGVHSPLRREARSISDCQSSRSEGEGITHSCPGLPNSDKCPHLPAKTANRENARFVGHMRRCASALGVGTTYVAMLPVARPETLRCAVSCAWSPDLAVHLRSDRSEL